ncbi:MAG TPA: endopeptidase La [Ktedonobacterales bacterium]|nr:endopeptidase La [Ktedonobacterales bacterium]
MATGKGSGSRRKANTPPLAVDGEAATILDEENTLAAVAQQELPVLPVRNTVLLPNIVTPFYVGRESSQRAVEEALAQQRAIVVVAQKDDSVEDPGPEDLYSVGTEGIIGRALKMPDGTTNVLIQGQRRVRLERVLRSGGILRTKVEPIEQEIEKTPPLEALMRATLALFEKCVKLSRALNEDAYITALNIDAPGALADFIISALEPPLPQRQLALETLDPTTRLQNVSVMLSKELHILELENQIQTEVQQEIDKSQREYFLREQLKTIQKELGEQDPTIRESIELREKIATCGMPTEVTERAYRELDRLVAMPTMAPELTILRTYLDWLVALPWHQSTEDRLDPKEAALILDENHFGLEKAKERIIEYIAVRKLAPTTRSPILCFVGPPGVGKTSLGRSIAQALNRKFVRLSLGGIRDEAEIRGHRRTYIGALPGRIIQTMRLAGTINPLFILDEIDKLGADYRGDPSAALLEVLDREQNHAFSDHYLEVPYDLSHVIFIMTANSLYSVPWALRDRMEVVELPGYTEEEKIQIARSFLIPKLMKDHGLTRGKIAVEDSAVRRVAREYTYEAGVRNLERELARTMRKVARQVVEGRKTKSAITEKNLPNYLGPPKYLRNEAQEQDEVGIATGLVWTSGGGDIQSIEVTLADGRGGLVMTGRLGEVMKESGHAALAYIRSHAKQLGIEPGFYERRDIHVHAPEGGQAKEGPSAGITIATAIISALTKRPIRRQVAMTGEITIHGRVLPIGGVKEKVLSAHRAGIETVLLPKRNEKDLEEIPEDVRKQIRFIFVERMEQVLEAALHPAEEDAADEKKKRPVDTSPGRRSSDSARQSGHDHRRPKQRLRRAHHKQQSDKRLAQQD